MMNIKITSETLTAYVLEELDDTQRANVERALASDPDLARELDELKGAATISSRIFHGEGAGTHTMTDEQIDWFKAGSALNKIKSVNG